MKRWMPLFLALLCSGALLRADEAEILQELKFGTSEKREQALDEVFAGHAPGAGPALLQVLSDSQGVFRLLVIWALGLLREDAAAGPISS